MIKWNEDKRTCIYTLMHEPLFSTVTPPMTLISRVSPHDITSLNFSTYCAELPKLRKFGQLYSNISPKN